MRNLKRALSLALAAVMVLGMMVVGASAVSVDDFSDKDEIVNTEAVSILTALNVINGKDDGSYDPTGIITRGEMAKLICVVLNGGKDPSLGSATSNTYTDTVNHWAAPYIEYCTQLGIVAGKGDGTFAPNDTVTATEAAKMLLVAMGYNASFEGMVGANWAVATNVVANSKGLYDGLSLDVDAGLTRDSAAQMVYNAINAKMVVYDYALVTGENGSLTSIPRVDDASYTILNNKFGAVRVEGVVTANEFTNNAVAMEGKTVLDISNDDELVVALGGNAGFTNSTFNTTTGKDEFGRAVILYVKPSTAAPHNAAKAEVITSAIMDDSNNIILNSTGRFNAAGTKTLATWADDNGMKLSGTTEYYTNYALDAGFTSAYANKNGVEIIVIDNDADGVAEVVLKNEYAFGQVTKYNTKDDGAVSVDTAQTGYGFTNVELKDIVAYDGIAKDDYVNYTKVSDTYYIVKAESATGNLDSFKTDKNVTVDGTTYSMSDRTAYTEDGLDTIGTIGSKEVVDNDVTVYLDAYGYAVAGTTAAASDFAFIANAAWNDTTASGLSSGTLTVYAILEDGTADTFVVDKIVTYASGVKTETKASAFSAATPATVKDGVYKYSLDSNKKMTLVAADSAVTAGEQYYINSTSGKYTIYNKGESTLKYNGDDNTGANATTAYITEDTVVFYVALDGGAIDSVKVYTGKTAPSMNYANTAPAKTVMVTNDENAKNLDAVVFMTAAPSISDDYIYLVDYVRTTSDGDVFWAVIDGEVKEVTVNEKQTGYKGLYEYVMDGDLYDIGGRPSNSDTGVVSLVDSKSIVIETLTGAVEKTITSNTVTAYLDGEDTDVESYKASKKDVVTIVWDDSNDVAAIYIVEEFDDTNSSVLAYSNNLTYMSGTKVYRGTHGNFGTVSAVKNAFVVSGGASKVLVANGENTTDLTATELAALTDVGSVTNNTAYKLVVIGEDGESYSVVNIEIGNVSYIDLSYNVGSGEGDFDTVAVAQNSTFELPTTKPTYTGYQFIGWSDGTDLYAAGDDIAVTTSNVNLTAVYLSDTVAATNDAANGLTAAGFKFTTTVDVNASVTAVSAKGTGTVCSAIDGATGTVAGTTELTATIGSGTGYDTNLASAAVATNDAITFTLTVTYKDTDTDTFDVTYTYAD